MMQALSKQRLLFRFFESLISRSKLAYSLLVKAEHTSNETEKQFLLAQSLHHRRILISRLRDPHAVNDLINEVGKAFLDRPGGYTQIFKLSQRRKSDDAEIVVMQLTGWQVEETLVTEVE